MKYTRAPWTFVGAEELNEVVAAGGRADLVVVRIESDHGPVFVGMSPALDCSLDEVLGNGRLMAKAAELFESLRWMTRCAKMAGPHGGWMYAISDKEMDKARALIAELEGGENV